MSFRTHEDALDLHSSAWCYQGRDGRAFSNVFLKEEFNVPLLESFSSFVNGTTFVRWSQLFLQGEFNVRVFLCFRFCFVM